MNEQAFTDFTQEQDSYFFGLLLADGTVCKDRNRISLALKESDLHIIEDFKKYIKSDNKITRTDKEGSIGYRLTFDNKQIKQTLLSQNLLPCKSTKEQLPNFDWLNNRHFWRGVIDGDGSVFYTNNSPKLSLCGSQELLDGFNKFCMTNCFTKPKKLYKTNTENFYTNLYCGEEALCVMKLLYDDSNYALLRKKCRVVEYEQKFVPKSPNKGIRLLPSGRYNVKIGYNRKRKSVGTFDTYEEALVARIQAEIDYQGKSPNGAITNTTN